MRENEMAEENKIEEVKETGTKKPIQGVFSILGSKVGMTQIFDDKGDQVGVTVVKAGPCYITQVKTKNKDGYNAIQVGFGKAKKLNKPMKGHLKELNARHFAEIKVDKPEDYKVGQEIGADIFQTGDIVEIVGDTIGKGFAGRIKRHHHHRGPMSHGSKCHRLPGSIGAGSTPGRVYKGLEMAGRLGGSKKTVKGVKVVVVDSTENLIMLNGPVPGKPGNTVVIAKQKKG
jgi:large subunit ribosomal protein L3